MFNNALIKHSIFYITMNNRLTEIVDFRVTTLRKFYAAHNHSRSTFLSSFLRAWI